MAVFPVGNRFIGLIYETDIESVRSQGGYRCKADGGIAEQRQSDAEGLVACP